MLLGKRFFEGDRMEEALGPLGLALELHEKVLGEMAQESAPYYHLYGRVLLAMAQSTSEQALQEAMIQALQSKMGGEEQAEAPAILPEQAEDFEEAWQCLEYARIIFEKAEDFAGASKVRMTLGDACMDLEDYEGAVKEFQSAADLCKKHIGLADRRTTEACFMLGLNLQMLGKTQEAITAYTEARDATAATIAAAKESDDVAAMTDILSDLNAKIQEQTSLLSNNNNAATDKRPNADQATASDVDGGDASTKKQKTE